MALHKTMLRKLALRLAALPSVQRALAERADLSAFKQRPRPSLMVGVGLVGLSFVVGWPGVGLFGFLAVYLHDPWYLLGGPLCYGLSWGIWGLGMIIAGPANIYYVKVLMYWGLRRFTENILGQDPPPSGGSGG